MTKPFTVPATGRDVFQAFVIPLKNDEDKYLVGFEYRPGNNRVVHHMIGFLDNTGKARELAKSTGDGDSYQSFGGPGFTPTGAVGGWAPGATPRILPEGIAKLVRKNSDIVLQTHYHPDGKTEQDQGSIALYFAKKKPEKILLGWPLGNFRIDIPPGENHYTKTIDYTLPVDVTLWGLTPHMHLIGKDMKATATLPDGTAVPLIWIKDWDFNWQGQYGFDKPLKLPKGTKIHVDAVYDNSADNPRNPNNPPKRVTFGEQTTNEMCFLFLQFTLDNPLDIINIRPKLMQRLQRGI